MEQEKRYLTEKFAAFVLETRYPDIPGEATHKAKQCILDTIGVTLAGSTDPVRSPVLKYLEEIGGKKQSTVIGVGLKTSAPQAALANGIFGHVLDYDDFNFCFIGHTTVVVVPVILALGEMLKSSGEEAITAFILGTEVQWRLGDALVAGGNHYSKGWHSTGTIGTIGAAAAAGKLLRLNFEEMANAFSIAVSEAAGIREQFGTMTKSFHAGRAAENGIVAALLAKGGFTGVRSAFEGPTGFLPLVADQYHLDQMRPFGRPWGILDPDAQRGVIFKLYPCCGSGDGAIDCIFALIKEHGLRAEDVASVECFAHERKVANLRYHLPQTGLEGKFSLEYWLTIALLDGQVGLQQFTDEKVRDPRVQEFMKRITFVADPEMPRFPVRIQVNMKNGQSHAKTFWPPKASPENPATDEELILKFRSCAEWYGLPPEKIEKSIDFILNLEKVKDLRPLLKWMVR